MTLIGILFAFGALVSWGFGDFLIQRATRRIGIIKTLFYIGVIGTVLLLPFLRRADFAFLTGLRTLAFLGLAAAIAYVAALFDFEAMKRGKIAVVEPIIGLELPLTIVLAVIVGTDVLTPAQTLVMACAFIGLMLAATVNFRTRLTKSSLERGAILAGIAAVCMAANNFTVGVVSQQTSPMVTIWFIHLAVAVVCGVHLGLRGQLRSLRDDIRQHGRLILAQGVLDTAAWACFAQATIRIPISIATTISESYVALAVLLGLIVSRESFRRHQIIGVAVTTVSIIVLAALTA